MKRYIVIGILLLVVLIQEARIHEDQTWVAGLIDFYRARYGLDAVADQGFKEQFAKKRIWWNW